jgi:hypothetical protein
MHFLLLSREEDCQRERAGYRSALGRAGVRLSFVDDYDPTVAIQDVLARCGSSPDWVLHVDVHQPYLPWGLMSSPIPTACFQIDTYAFTAARIRWARLFDHVIVFHPGFEDAFRAAGCPSTLLLPHAVQASQAGLASQRVFDIGWVGQTERGIYLTRRRILKCLAGRYRMNDWQRSYSPSELHEIYSRSKVVVNIPRDDYLRDANLRTFEAMAAGALLVAPLPSEMTDIGFQEGVHFVGFSGEQQLFSLLDHFLTCDVERRAIAEAGKAKVLAEHTYDCRASRLAMFASGPGSRRFAPGRGWSEAKAHATYLDYYAAHRQPDLAALHWNGAIRGGARCAAESLLRLSTAYARRLLVPES